MSKMRQLSEINIFPIILFLVISIGYYAEQKQMWKVQLIAFSSLFLSIFLVYKKLKPKSVWKKVKKRRGFLKG